MAPVSARPPEIQGPIVGQPVVEAWIDQYIRFEHRSAEQGSLRTEIRARVRQLKSRPDEILQAAFLGDKHPAADVENLVLYYIDDTGASFTDAAKVGLRFELGPEPGPSPTRKKYAYGYRYELVKCDSSLRYWQEGRALASWDWIDLGPFSGPKQLEQVWLALARAQVEASRPCRSPETPFAVRLSIRVPRGVTPVLGGLVKGVVDGVVCAFQAHIDLSNVDELARRVSRSVSATPEEIRDVLVSEQNAVLGAVPRLLHNRGQGVIWSPADDLCVAGELFADPASDQGWSIKGSITELLPT